MAPADVSAVTTDRELIGRLKCGDLPALGYLYDHHRQMVFRTALSRGIMTPRLTCCKMCF